MMKISVPKTPLVAKHKSKGRKEARRKFWTAYPAPTAPKRAARYQPTRTQFSLLAARKRYSAGKAMSPVHSNVVHPLNRNGGLLRTHNSRTGRRRIAIWNNKVIGTPSNRYSFTAR